MEPTIESWPVNPDLVRGEIRSVIKSVIARGELDDCSVEWLPTGACPSADHVDHAPGAPWGDVSPAVGPGRCSG